MDVSKKSPIKKKAWDFTFLKILLLVLSFFGFCLSFSDKVVFEFNMNLYLATILVFLLTYREGK